MTRFRDILRTLATHKVDFIVVGGISAVLHGAPVNTLDLDIVHSREEANISRLLAALDEVDATYRELSSERCQPLATRAGPLDILGTIGRDLSYLDLLPHTSEMIMAEKSDRQGPRPCNAHRD